MRLNRFGIKTVTGPWLSRFESVFPQTLMNILSESGTGLATGNRNERQSFALSRAYSKEKKYQTMKYGMRAMIYLENI